MIVLVLWVCDFVVVFDPLVIVCLRLLYGIACVAWVVLICALRYVGYVICLRLMFWIFLVVICVVWLVFGLLV